MEIIWKKITESPDETWKIAADFVKNLKKGDVIACHGDLGAEKLASFKESDSNIREPVNSPTYTLIHEYKSEPMLLSYGSL